MADIPRGFILTRTGGRFAIAHIIRYYSDDNGGTMFHTSDCQTSGVDDYFLLGESPEEIDAMIVKAQMIEAYATPSIFPGYDQYSGGPYVGYPLNGKSEPRSFIPNVTFDNPNNRQRMNTETATEYAAMAAHNANSALCLAHDDNSCPSWENAAEWQRESARAGVRTVIADPTITAELLHEKWSAFKIADGWVVGEVKDSALKTHPCLIPYDQLPEHQRAKDAIFGTVVRAMLDALAPGWQHE